MTVSEGDNSHVMEAVEGDTGDDHPAKSQDGSVSQRLLDMAVPSSMDMQALNDMIVKMRKSVRSVKKLTCWDLIRKIKKLRKQEEAGKGSSPASNAEHEEENIDAAVGDGSDEPLDATVPAGRRLKPVSKSQKRLERLSKELATVKAVKNDGVSKFALGNETSLSKICGQPGASSHMKAMIRLTEHKQLKEVVLKWRQEHADWRALASFVSQKNTGRRFKQKKKKLQRKKKKSRKVAAVTDADVFQEAVVSRVQESIVRQDESGDQLEDGAMESLLQGETIFDVEVVKKTTGTEGGKDRISKAKDKLHKANTSAASKQTSTDIRIVDLPVSALPDQNRLMESGAGSTQMKPKKGKVGRSKDLPSKPVETMAINIETSQPITSPVHRRPTGEAVVKRINMQELKRKSVIPVDTDTDATAADAKVPITLPKKLKKDSFFLSSGGGDDDSDTSEDEDTQGRGVGLTEPKTARLSFKMGNQTVSSLKVQSGPKGQSGAKAKFDRRHPKREGHLNNPKSKKPVTSAKKEEALHPSWEASKRKKALEQKIVPFEGKKVTFDDSD